MDKSILIPVLDLCLIALVCFLRSRAEKNPNQLWVARLYGRQLGPRSDVKYMSKAELYVSGLSFILWV